MLVQIIMHGMFSLYQPIIDDIEHIMHDDIGYLILDYPMSYLNIILISVYSSIHHLT